jgi:hypothetical protein
MKRWDLEQFLDNFTEKERSLDVGDNTQILYGENMLPIKIDGIVQTKLKILKGSYCIYNLDPNLYFHQKNKVEMLAIEEYSDSPYSIYINNLGEVESFFCKINHSIEIANKFTLHVQNNQVVGYSEIIPSRLNNRSIPVLTPAA